MFDKIKSLFSGSAEAADENEIDAQTAARGAAPRIAGRACARRISPAPGMTIRTSPRSPFPVQRPASRLAADLAPASPSDNATATHLLTAIRNGVSSWPSFIFSTRR